MIAVWFMDDGSNNGTTATLNTHSFSREDQLKMIDFLRDRFEINATIVKDRDKLKINFGAQAFQKLISIIRLYVVPSMNYKIVYPRNDLSISLDRASHKAC